MVAVKGESHIPCNGIPIPTTMDVSGFSSHDRSTIMLRILHSICLSNENLMKVLCFSFFSFHISCKFINVNFFCIVIHEFHPTIFLSSETFDPTILDGEGSLLTLLDFALISLAWSYFKDCTTGNAENEDCGKNKRTENMSEVS